MKILKKTKFGVGIGLFCLAVFASLIAFFIGNHRQVQAAGPVGYTYSDLSKARDNKDSNSFYKQFFFVGGPDNIEADLTLNGQPHAPVIFSKGVNCPNQISKGTSCYYAAPQGTFCTPVNGVVIDPKAYDSRQSALYVTFVNDDPKNFVATIAITDFLHQSVLWPGKDGQSSSGVYNCGQPHYNGKNIDYYSPVIFGGGYIKAKSNANFGPGNQYTDAVIGRASYSFVNGGVIKMEFDPNDIKNAPKDNPIASPIYFTDKDPTDLTPNYQSASVFCKDINGTSSASIDLKGSMDLNTAKVAGVIHIREYTKNGCSSTKDINIPNINNKTDSLADGSTGYLGQEIFQWAGDNIDSITCSNSFDSTANQSSYSCKTNWGTSLVQGSQTQYQKNPDSQCDSDVINLANPNGNTGSYYKGSLANNKCNHNNLRKVAIMLAPGAGGGTPVGVGEKCDSGNDCKNGICQQPAGGGKPDCFFSGGKSGSDTCDLNSNGFTLAWAICPVLEAMDALATNLMNAFEDQLSFSVDQTGANCSKSQVAQKLYNNGNCGQNIGTTQNYDSLRRAWGVMRDIASAVLVILMLMMVFSQAVGAGPFDAYAVRKFLPRMVVAAILIQISWNLMAWTIDLFNDLGNGLGSLIAAPFGGADSLTFGKLLAHMGVTTGEGALLSWAAVGFGAVLLVAFLPTIFFLIIAIIVALLTGFLVLIFRKILILMLLIFSPIAIALWILPGQGTQRYYKMWQENFLKVLMMFPMLVAIIYSGRVFAYVTGATTDPKFISFIFLMVGYFFPLFLLPKVYKWGGGLMNTVGSAANNLQSRGVGAIKQPLIEWGKERWTDKRASNFNPHTASLLGIRQGRFPGAGYIGRGWQSARAGRLIPTSKAYAKMVKRGNQWSGTMHERNDAVVDKWVRSAQDTGITQQMADRGNKLMRKLGYKGPDTFRAMAPGSGAAKEAARLLYVQAYDGKGDKELRKSINEYFVRSRSNLEFRRHNFIVPDKKPDYELDRDADGNIIPGQDKLEFVPAYVSREMGDRQLKDNQVYQDMGGMGSDLAWHNHRRGGGSYQGVYMRGKRYLSEADKAAGRVNPDFDERIADAFEIEPDTIEYGDAYDQGGNIIHETNADGSVKLDNAGNPVAKQIPIATPKQPREFLAQTLKAVDEDGFNLLIPGGSSANAVLKNYQGWADTGSMVEYEMVPEEVNGQPVMIQARDPKGDVIIDKATDKPKLVQRMIPKMERDADGVERPVLVKSALPAQDLAKKLIEGARSAQTRSRIAVVHSEPTTREGVDAVLKKSGYTHFKDKMGRVWKLNVDNLWKANENAETVIAGRATRGEAAPEEPPLKLGAEGSMLTADDVSTLPSDQIYDIHDNMPPPEVASGRTTGAATASSVATESATESAAEAATEPAAPTIIIPHTYRPRGDRGDEPEAPAAGPAPEPPSGGGGGGGRRRAPRIPGGTDNHPAFDNEFEVIAEPAPMAATTATPDRAAAPRIVSGSTSTPIGLQTTAKPISVTPAVSQSTSAPIRIQTTSAPITGASTVITPATPVSAAQVAPEQLRTAPVLTSQGTRINTGTTTVLGPQAVENGPATVSARPATVTVESAPQPAASTSGVRIVSGGSVQSEINAARTGAPTAASSTVSRGTSTQAAPVAESTPFFGAEPEAAATTSSSGSSGTGQGGQTAAQAGGGGASVGGGTNVGGGGSQGGNTGGGGPGQSGSSSTGSSGGPVSIGGMPSLKADAQSGTLEVSHTSGTNQPPQIIKETKIIEKAPAVDSKPTRPDSDRGIDVDEIGRTMYESTRAAMKDALRGLPKGTAIPGTGLANGLPGQDRRLRDDIFKPTGQESAKEPKTVPPEK